MTLNIRKSLSSLGILITCKLYCSGSISFYFPPVPVTVSKLGEWLANSFHKSNNILPVVSMEEVKLQKLAQILTVALFWRPRDLKNFTKQVYISHIPTQHNHKLCCSYKQWNVRILNQSFNYQSCNDFSSTFFLLQQNHSHYCYCFKALKSLPSEFFQSTETFHEAITVGETEKVKLTHSLSLSPSLPLSLSLCFSPTPPSLLLSLGSSIRM